MASMNRLLPLVVALLLAMSNVLAQSPKQNSTTQAATKQIHAVVEAFRTSIIEKDRAKFLGTLYNESIPWIGIYEEQTIRRIRDASAEPEKRSRELKGTAKRFIDGIVASPAKQEEKFWNVRITTDGSIGTVLFDYNFQVAGTITNWGKESWHLVHTDAGWKINSVIYTVTLPAQPKRREIPVDASVVKSYVGTYEFRPGVNLVFALVNDRLTISLGGEPPLYLLAETSARWFDKLYGATSEFVRDEQGAVTHVNFILDGKVTKAQRLPSP